MLKVKTPEEAAKIIYDRFPPLSVQTNLIDTVPACGRILYSDVISEEYVPGFNRSTVDGYAVRAADTFGCSSSIPAVLNLSGEILMGVEAHKNLREGECAAISTGGDLPEEADAVVMLEHTEDYGEGFVGITRPSAPGENIIFKGDDTAPGDVIIRAGTRLTPHDIGILSALGITSVGVRPVPSAGIISTGDELVAPCETPGRGQIRDVNTPMLEAALRKFGAEARSYGIIKDSEDSLKTAVAQAVSECDIILISGGSSAGARDMTAKVISSDGEVIFHGIAMKPGKPTILGSMADKPVFGLPGHPVAAYFVTELFVRPLIARLTGGVLKRFAIPARLREAVSANHGRAEYMAVYLESGHGLPEALPIRSKSGLIGSLAGSDGYILIPRDCEGFPKGAEVSVTLWS